MNLTIIWRTLATRISSYILFIVVAAAPFPFGSTDPIAVAVWCIVLGLGILIVPFRAVRPEHFPLLGLAIVLVLAYAFVLHEQLAARPWVASPHPIWRETAEALGISLEPSVSIARNQPFFSLGAPLANILALIFSFIVCVDRHRARQLFLVIAWAGVAYSIFGMAAYLIDPTHILWREKIAYRDVLTSTFINRNTAAVYFGSCGVLWLLLLSERVRQHLPPGPIYWRGLLRRLLTETPRPVGLYFAMLFVCLTAMLMTNSRAGIVLSLLSLVVAFATFFRRDVSGRGGIAAMLMIGGFVVLLLLQVLGGKVSGRFDMQGLSDEGRIETYRSTLKMIVDYPWFGTGLGTFTWSLPAYRSANISMWGVWDRAHSTPLELASDLGLPLAGLIFLAWIVVLILLIRGVRTRRRDQIMPIGALTVALLSLTHSVIDFSLQIPGYAIVVFSLVGAGLAQSFSSNGGDNIYSNISETPSGPPAV